MNTESLAASLFQQLQQGQGLQQVSQQLGLDSGGSLSERLSYRLTLNQQAGNGWVDRTASRSLALSAALFRNERQNYKVADPNNPDNPSGTQQLDGKARVDGIALGVAGNLTRAWSIFANYTYLKTYGDYGAATGSTPCARRARV